jgi:hypothetical protein
MDLNQSILSETMKWGLSLPGFKRAHAVNALTIVKGYVEGLADEQGHFIPGVGTGDQEKFCLFAINLAWTFWIDEIFDAQKGDADPFVDVESIIRVISADEQPTTVASQGFSHLRSRFRAYQKFEDEYRFWMQTAADAVRAWHIEERISRRLLSPSYSEYLENGYNSTAVPHIVAAGSLIYGLGLASRMAEPTVQRLVRNLSVSCRLHNDLYSVEKERAEGSCANAVLILDRVLPCEVSRALAADDLLGYERMLKQDIAVLGERDLLARLARVMPEAHRVLYTNPDGDYQKRHEPVQGGLTS